MSRTTSICILVILREALGVVVVGGVAWGPRAKLDNSPGWQFDVGYFGGVAIKPIEVINEILLADG